MPKLSVMTEPTQSQKSIAILKALGYRVSYNNGEGLWLLHNVDSNNFWATFEDEAWGSINCFTSYEICFEGIVPMMERKGFRFVVDTFIDTESGILRRVTFEHYDVHEGVNKDIRIAICEATYSFLKAEGKG